MNSSATNRIRELDGLRGFAALLVVAGHVVGAGRASGGVDVLIFLSGFFLGAVILRYPNRPFGMRLAGYVSRLLPLAALVLLSILMLAFLGGAPKPLRTLIPEVIYSILMVENWVLAFRSIDYFENDGWRSMAQHFWAVSTQVQLFVLFLGLVTFSQKIKTERTRELTFVLLGSATLLSLVYSAWITRTSPEFAYFDTFARAWEFGFGALLAMSLTKVPRWIGSNGLAVFLGLGLIISTFFFFRSGQFPFPAAVAPILGAILFVLGATGDHQGIGRRLSRSRPAVFVGSLSYAIYLWHWPIHLIVLDRFYGLYFSPLTRFFIVLTLTILLSWASVRFVERATVTNLRRLKPLAQVATSFLIVALVGLSGLASRGVLEIREQNTYTSVLSPYTSFSEVRSDRQVSAKDGCQLGKGEFAIEDCVPYGDPEGDKVVMLVGASHAAMWHEAISGASAELGWRLVVVTKGGCRLSIEENPSDEACALWRQNVLIEVEKVQPDLVITTSTVTTFSGKETIPAGYTLFWERLSTLELPVLMIRDVPRWSSNPIDCVERFPESHAEFCVMPSESRLSEVEPWLDLAADYPAFTFVDFTDWVCPGGICRARDEDGFIYRDLGHITASFSNRSSELFLELLRTY